ncbi:MAG: U32 family peptidase, partial [Verrucomicrobiae bacterium]|nr:U32 family peptidase [Verrucomicrobiae bacterium]
GSELILRVLCRTSEQIEAALEAGVTRIYADFEDLRRYDDAVRSVRRADGAEIFLATPRIQKAGEVGLFRTVERAEPDGVLVRNLGGIDFFQGTGLEMVGDFSLNVANPISAAFFMEQGFEHLTVSYDLNISQVLDLLAAASPDWFELTLHQHMPMFHMEHCVYCAFLSKGKDFKDCGRPCDTHEVKLRDRVGQLHLLSADTGCRNTLFNGRAQSGARFLSDLTGSGLRRYRVELLRESKEEALRTIRTYQDLLDGRIDGTSLWETLRVESRLGVTEGTLVESLG